MIEHEIVKIRNYPDDGRHLECVTRMPFQIRRGQDGYFWRDSKGEEHGYNIRKGRQDRNWVDDRWIVHLTEDANKSLESIFEVMVHGSLDRVLEYCSAVYRRSLLMEVERLTAEMVELDRVMKDKRKTKNDTKK